MPTQAALLGLVGLILAFGLSLAVGRYEDRRAAVVAARPSSPTRIRSAPRISARRRSPIRFGAVRLPLFVDYTDAAIRLSYAIAGSAAQARAVADGAGCSANCGGSRGSR